MAKLEGTDVSSFQRGPTWIVSRMTPGALLGSDDPSYNPPYTDEDRKRFRENPSELKKYRKTLIHNVNSAFRMVYPSSTTFSLCY